MTRGSKKPKLPKELNEDYEISLIKKREKLKKQLELSRKEASSEVGSAGFWGIVGGIALAGDVFILGGIGTGIALISTAFWADHRQDARNLQKQLKEVEDNLLLYKEIKLIIKPTEPETKPLPPSVKNDFDENAALKKRLADVERQLEDLQNPKPVRLDKNPPPPKPTFP